ncbi:LexA family transcriptional regulator [Avibacterium avium]|uniref:LexA family transcriptional regulator n=1 Tax=Avibacterium avium TaxID=751 RepID=UPI003BF7AE7A
MTTLGKRIERVMAERKISREKLASALDISTMAVGNLINDKTKKPRNLIEIAEFLGVNPKWLQTGNGIMTGGDSEFNNSPITNTISYGASHSDKKLPLVQSELDDEHRYRIDYLDVRAAAGITGFINSDYPEIINKIYLSEDGLRKLVGRKNTNGICLISVPTDSMEPTIQKGDVVLIDMNIKHYNGDGIYAFAINGELFIKRLQKMISGGFKAISDNKERYDPEDMNDETYKNAQFVGKFIRRWRIDVKDL